MGGAPAVGSVAVRLPSMGSGGAAGIGVSRGRSGVEKGGVGLPLAPPVKCCNG